VRPRLAVSILLFCLFALPVVAQDSQQPSQSSAPGKNFPQGQADESDIRDRMASDLAKKAAKERVAALKNDTDKLLKLSVELKSYVDKSDENVLSLDVIKKAEEIEKLAKSVKDKMKGPN
jgi:cell division protein FtsI/penicillin-binding protein 2